MVTFATWFKPEEEHIVNNVWYNTNAYIELGIYTTDNERAVFFTTDKSEVNKVLALIGKDCIFV